jgi:hypothetical protein
MLYGCSMVLSLCGVMVSLGAFLGISGLVGLVGLLDPVFHGVLQEKVYCVVLCCGGDVRTCCLMLRDAGGVKGDFRNCYVMP